ncbi:hypothetical protein [Streptomyces sp. NBRC 110028]|uniref:hypothetical protein n=1 Tax=Streptomyces sp. NBRC 110028 TaxID=1621260 RepID=UPI0006E3675B|nr:hypothetical protein [Streptomyces sp. NBRC 110028]
MHRSAPRLARILACATVPIMLVAGCSSGSEDKKDTEGPSRPSSPSASPSVAAAKFSKLPDVCSALSGKTIDKLVPKAKTKKGKALPSSDTNTSATCLWSGLDGFKYRSLSLSLKLFPSDAGLGAGDKRAQEYATQQASKASSADGVKNPKTEQAAVGDAATTVRTEEKKDGDDFRNQTVVARTANVVITIEYDGAGYETEKTPDATKLMEDAKSAAKEVVDSVEKGTKGAGGGQESPASGGSKSAEPSKDSKESKGSKDSKDS